MSDVMFYGVLRMPYELAMADELSRFQFYSSVQEAVDRVERAESRIAELEAALAAAPPVPDEAKDAEPNWKAFALAVLINARDSLGSDVDGGLVQDVAAEYGLLEKEAVTESCGSEYCACAEYGFPTECFRYSAGTIKAIHEDVALRANGNHEQSELQRNTSGS